MSQLPITMTGRLTHNPELTKVSAEMYKTRFRIASSRRYPVQQKDGPIEWRDIDRIFLDAEVWGQTAINVKKSLFKGMPVIVVGSLVTDFWKDRNGVEQSRTFLKVNQVGLDLNRFVVSALKVETVYDQEGIKPPWMGNNPPEPDIDRTASAGEDAAGEDAAGEDAAGDESAAPAANADGTAGGEASEGTGSAEGAQGLEHDLEPDAELDTGMDPGMDPGMETGMDPGMDTEAPVREEVFA